MYYEALKQAIALFGDMEQHAIQQAGSINDTGRYRIGRIANKADSEDLVEVRSQLMIFFCVIIL